MGVGKWRMVVFGDKAACCVIIRFMEQADWTQVLLASSAVALMAVTVLVAMAAIGGWFWMNRVARNTAEQVARKMMEDFLADANIREMLRKEVEREAGVLYGDMEQSPTHNLNRNEE